MLRKLNYFHHQYTIKVNKTTTNKNICLTHFSYVTVIIDNKRLNIITVRYSKHIEIIEYLVFQKREKMKKSEKK